MTKNLLVLREDDDSIDEADGKSPHSALIGGLVAGLASLALLVLIFYVLWRTRKRSYLTAQPERILPVRDGSRVSSRSGVNPDASEEEKATGPRVSRASSRTQTRLPEDDANPGRISLA